MTTAAKASHLVDRVLPVLLFAAVVCFAVHKIVAYDVWWQLETGHWVLSHGFPSTDPFSYATPDREWIEMRWLYCSSAYLLFTTFGLNSLIVAKTAIVLVAFACLWLADPKAPAWAKCLGVACALAAAHLRFLIRPEIVTLVLVAFLLMALWRYRSGGRAWWIYALPLVQVVWTNSHTVFVLGPVTVWIFAIAELAAGYAPVRLVRENALPLARVKPLLIVAAASTVACFVSPYFVQGALYPIQLFNQIQAGNAIRDLITELQSPFAYAGFTPFFLRYPVVVAISAVGIALNWRRLAPGLVALWGAYLYLSAQSERNVTLFGFVAEVVAIVNYGQAARAASESRSTTAVAWAARALCAVFALVAIPAVATDYYYQKIDPARRFGFGVAKNRFPIRAMAFVDAERLPGPILANLVDSSFVLFDRGPKSTYVDGRLEVYGGDLVKQADDLFRTGKGFDEAVARNGIGTVLVAHGTDGTLFRLINRRSDWAPVYFDETHAVFARVTPETRALVEPLRIDWSAPVRREAPVAPELDPPDRLAGLWPRVADDVAPKALGQLALLTGNLPLARERFEEAYAARPDDADAALHLGVVCRALGDDARADELLARAGGDATRIRTPLAAATAFESSDSLEASIATYQAAIARGDAPPELYDRLAKIAMGLNRFDTAVEAYRQMAARQPGSEAPWNGLGMIALRRDAYEDAVASLERSVEINPRQPVALTALGVAHAKMNRPDLAREAFTRALEVDPNYQPARQQLNALGG